MSEPLENLERQVEGEMGLLAPLPDHLEPRAEQLTALKAAVIREARNLGGLPKAARVLPRWVGMAAAVMLAVGLSGFLTRGPLTSNLALDDEELLSAWTEAVGRSSDRLTFLLDDGWLINGAADYDDGETTEFDGLLESLEQSFEHFETL
ncbi:MAG: hypothetical protein ABIG44_18000 [Planctomycetota bacterium]